MIDPSGITSRVLDSLSAAGLLTPEQISSLERQAAEAGVSVGSALIERGLVSSADIESVLEHEMGVPHVDLSSYAPEDSALALVPSTIARTRRVLPLFEIEGMLTVAVGEPMDVFTLDDLAAELGVEVEPVLADPAAVSAAIAQYYGEAAAEPGPAPRVSGETGASAEPGSTSSAGTPGLAVSDFFGEYSEEEATPSVPVVPIAEAAEEPARQPVETIQEMVEAPPPEGPPAIDLDILAVADSRKVAVLVTEILEHAVSRGASMIHLLPYKDDFFLVYRVKGVLEKVASAPLSLQGALIDAFKSFAKMSVETGSNPSFARTRTRVGDRDLVVTVSSVPTIAGQRMVISLEGRRPEPKGLSELGMSDAEARALHAMVERGRGLLLLCAPVAAGASSTYYALLAHAAKVGKTVYSVEYSIDYEIPAVAQVVVNTASPVPAANYIAAGLRQDTDVIAVDSIRSVEDVHIAVEAAGLGKLVIATFPAADVASGVSRLLALGVEPHSLASALTLGVGQRLVRLNCRSCTQEAPSAALAKLPGVPEGTVNKAGTGCPNCGKTGFRGATGIFEVLPFTEPVRSVVAAGGSAPQIAAAAEAAGMRPLIASGLARVISGQVSADEL
ncbi:MAG: ATPase, T2SS/T4P/T4SS family, partial [Coriobacteriales bacterium]